MEPSLTGLLFAAAFTALLLKTKPAFFWEHHKMKRTRHELGDVMTERLGYGFIGFITLLFLVLFWLDN